MWTLNLYNTLSLNVHQKTKTTDINKVDVLTLQDEVR